MLHRRITTTLLTLCLLTPMTGVATNAAMATEIDDMSAAQSTVSHGLAAQGIFSGGHPYRFGGSLSLDGSVNGSGLFGVTASAGVQSIYGQLERGVALNATHRRNGLGESHTLLYVSGGLGNFGGSVGIGMKELLSGDELRPDIHANVSAWLGARTLRLEAHWNAPWLAVIGDNMTFALSGVAAERVRYRVGVSMTAREGDMSFIHGGVKVADKVWVHAKLQASELRYNGTLGAEFRL